MTPFHYAVRRSVNTLASANSVPFVSRSRRVTRTGKVIYGVRIDSGSSHIKVPGDQIEDMIEDIESMSLDTEHGLEIRFGDHSVFVSKDHVTQLISDINSLLARVLADQEDEDKVHSA